MVDTKRFGDIIDSFYKQLLRTHHEITDRKLSEDRWSPKRNHRTSD